ncbi:MFS transporter [Blumeria hordei DH14]|uniref:MFS transporter n=1 Tax=Blumeria graminis f. sp. hordei (strain DH14) TaxID=546991 RepID=N1JFD0_BLUG1|nr:MFS transporter [Blumeria hordei DH14]
MAANRAQNAFEAKEENRLDVYLDSSYNSETSTLRVPSHSSEDSLHQRTNKKRENSNSQLHIVSSNEDTDTPKMGRNKPFPKLIEPRFDYVVEFNGPDDPINAKNWPLRRNLFVNGARIHNVLTVFTSSVFSIASPFISHEFRVSEKLSLLGLTLYIMGFAFAPTFWGPLSELKGRKMPIVLAMLGFTLFQIGVGVADDIQPILIFRFLGGVFGAAPITITAAVFSDMYDNKTRGIAITILSTFVFIGPAIAPCIGGFIVRSSHQWRWIQWLVTILGFIAFLLNIFFLEETYAQTILVAKAVEIRSQTKNWAVHAEHEMLDFSPQSLIIKNFCRPLRLLFTEPIVFLMSLYSSFAFGLLYLSIGSYSAVFIKIYRLPLGISGLPNIGMAVGIVFACIYLLLLQPSYARKLAANDNVPIPEWRLPSMTTGGIAFSCGILWFGWTGYNPSIHWIVPTLSGIFTGFGILVILIQVINYLVDAYLDTAASVIAASMMFRSLAGALFPLFFDSMFKSLGINWTATILGCIALLLVPVSILFYYFGAKIRSKSLSSPPRE